VSPQSFSFSLQWFVVVPYITCSLMPAPPMTSTRGVSKKGEGYSPVCTLFHRP